VSPFVRRQHRGPGLSIPRPSVLVRYAAAFPVLAKFGKQALHTTFREHAFPKGEGIMVYELPSLLRTNLRNIAGQLID
jgi:hypothetical protein